MRAVNPEGVSVVGALCLGASLDINKAGCDAKGLQQKESPQRGSLKENQTGRML